MEIPVIIEPVPGNGFRARGLEPYGFSAEGSTREEVLAKLKEQVQDRLREGAELVLLEVGGKDVGNPWEEFAGMFKDDPYFEEWQHAIAENRRKAEESPDVP